MSTSNVELIVLEAHDGNNNATIETNLSTTTVDLDTTHNRPALIVAQICLVSILCSVSTGILTIGISEITRLLGIDSSLTTWPILVYNLVSGALLLLAGSTADAIGDRLTNAASVFLLGLFTLACGFSKTGSQLIAFRALAGVGLAFFLPTSISVVSSNVPPGKMRNLSFSLIGVGQVIGYGIGLIIGGILIDTIGWRFGFYMNGGLLLLLFGTLLWSMPLNYTVHTAPFKRVDWIGLVMLSTSLTLLSYALAKISSKPSGISTSLLSSLLVVSVALLPATGVWFYFQEKHRRPALIPNSLWKNSAFTAICFMTMLAYAEMATMELLTSLFYQEVQQLSPTQASIRLIPSLVTGIILEISIGTLVHKLSVYYLVIFSSLISAGSPLLMALTKPEWPYWWSQFPAQILYPLCADVLFVIALLIISDTFPDENQALAGAVFNTVGQFGQSLGLALIGVVTSVVEGSNDSILSLLKGYRAGFWTVTAWTILICIIGAFGLRSSGRIGLKRD